MVFSPFFIPFGVCFGSLDNLDLVVTQGVLVLALRELKHVKVKRCVITEFLCF